MLLQNSFNIKKLSKPSSDRRDLPSLLCPGQIILIDKFVTAKKLFHGKMVKTVISSHRVADIRHCLLFSKHLFRNFETFCDDFGSADLCTGSVYGKNVPTKKYYPTGDVSQELKRLKDFWPIFSSGRLDKVPRDLKDTAFFQDYLRENVDLLRLQELYEKESFDFVNIRPCLLVSKVVK